MKESAPPLPDEIPMGFAAVLEQHLSRRTHMLRALDGLSDGAFENDIDRGKSVRVPRKEQLSPMRHFGQPKIADRSFSEDATQSRPVEAETVFDGQAGKW